MTFLEITAKRSRLLINYFQIDVSPLFFFFLLQVCRRKKRIMLFHIRKRKNYIAHAKYCLREVAQAKNDLISD